MGKFTVIPQDTFQGLQLDAGVVLTQFDPTAPAVLDEAIVCATTGGINITCQPTYSDLGEDVDNCPVNMKELKHLDSWACGMSFTSIATNPRSIRLALGAADIEAVTGAIKPRRNLKQDDFADLWWVGDRADGGCVAVQLKNALSTAGFTLQTTKAGKGQVSVELTGHVSLADQNTMPMVIYSLDASENPNTFSVTQTLTNVTSSFSANTVNEGETLTAELTADSGYAISSVSVYVGGVDVTATVYDDSTDTVTITSVSGNVTITATAEEGA